MQADGKLSEKWESTLTEKQTEAEQRLSSRLKNMEAETREKFISDNNLGYMFDSEGNIRTAAEDYIVPAYNSDAVSFSAREDVNRGTLQYVPTQNEVRADIKTAIVINRTMDGGDLFDVKLTQKQAYEILKRHPKIYDAEESPLGDLFDEYWEVGAKDYMIREAAKNLDSIGLMDSDYTAFRNYPNELHEAIRDVLGYDGIEVRFDNTNEKFYVAWFENKSNRQAIKILRPITIYVILLPKMKVRSIIKRKRRRTEMDEKGKSEILVGFKVGDSIQVLPEDQYEEWLIYKKNLEKQRAKESQAESKNSLKNQKD